MKKRVTAYGSDIPQDLIDSLRSEFDVTAVPDPASERAALVQSIADAHGLVGSAVKFGPELLEGARQLEVISSISVGYDNFDVPYLTRRGIMLTNTPDVLTESTADTGFALLMAAARRIVELAEYIKQGRWQRAVGPSQFGTDVHGKTLGIVGFGRIGQAVARRGHFGFGMKILYWNRSQKQEAAALDATFRALDELLAESDFVCVTVPLTAETEHLIGARQFALMQRGAVFVNIARGRVVDEQALIEALQSGRIRGAGLDVFEREPLPPDSALLAMPNVVATPHIGSATTATRHAMAELAVKNLRAALRGERPPNLVNNPNAS